MKTNILESQNPINANLDKICLEVFWENYIERFLSYKMKGGLNYVLIEYGEYLRLLRDDDMKMLCWNSKYQLEVF